MDAYRCGWAEKPGQEVVLGIDVSRAGFERALGHACLSHFDPDGGADHAAWSQRPTTSPVRVQWDPERSLELWELPYRSVQIGLSGVAVERYVDEWTVALTDVTGAARAIRDRLRDGDRTGAAALLPAERPYPLPAPVGASIGADPT